MCGLMADPRAGYLAGPMTMWASRFRAQFENVKRQHRGEQGRRREDDVKEFLREFLPKRFGIASGEVRCADGRGSPQMDLIIYDALETPLLEHSESSIVLPVEGVLAVIEVSSQLDRTKLQNDLAKLRAVKSMPKTAFYEPLGHNPWGFYGRQLNVFPVLGFCFAYDSPSAESLVRTVHGLDAEDMAINVDTIVSLSAGCVANGERAVTPAGERIFRKWLGTPFTESERFAIPVDPGGPNAGDGLMVFYILMMHALAQARVAPIRVLDYMEIRSP
jgi:hypothetical protein